MNATTRRLNALGRAELTLLVRNRTTLFVALLMPPAMIMLMASTLDGMDLGPTGMSIGEATMTGAIGMVLILVVHLNLVSAYVARREELVLKRLRTGEVPDHEILTGTALPAVGLALAQCLLIVIAGMALLDLGAPRRPDLLVVGILLGTLLMAALAAATSAFTRTVESSQITTMPMFLISLPGSGLLFPLDVLPDKIASVCELLPLTGAMTLVRAGWLGDTGSGELLGAAVTALAWVVVSVFAVQRWFRWEPRR
ncbi:MULTISPECIES: ABC transporter permease [unclassified Streptomyces]|uniref:ABC transporter permease n=1 Tax=unclassified Streptomyces TaxID=2593676 RepID=UPI0028C43F65|nr:MULTISPECIES: ABC transporter permease [unclassified Streptomyces]WNO73690.1 ABC transporter permease [Streptomyces sp. AM8-1-1]